MRIVSESVCGYNAGNSIFSKEDRMEPAKSVKELKASLASALSFDGGKVTVSSWDNVQNSAADILAWTVAHSADEETRLTGAWIVRNLAQQAGNGPASIHDVYLARGRGELPSTFTVPAINVRAHAYFFARAILRAAKKADAAAILFEIARSEMNYTGQPPYEYSCSILCAALREGYKSPIFIQGDHFQFNAAKFAKDPAGEFEGIKKITQQSIEAGFYNIDIDSSTLVDLAKPTIPEQQHANSEQCARLTEFIRSVEPKGIKVSCGGEIGEVGHKNSTVEELEAFMEGYKKMLKPGVEGISKVSVQTGTSHGGVVLADGTIAKVKVDFDTLKALGDFAKKKYGMAGAVQHGASTLPMDYFDKFPEVGTAEIHLATEYQNIMYEHPQFPADLKAKIYEWLKKECAKEAKEGETESQFIYKTRKKAIGPFKKEMWSIPDSAMKEIMKAYEDRCDLLFKKLNIAGTAQSIKPFAKPVNVPLVLPKTISHEKGFEGDD